MDKKISFKARGIIINAQQEILLCQIKGDSWFFLPGGSVEQGESVQDALIRELNEELSLSNYSIASFIGVIENTFTIKDQLYHELAFIFLLDPLKNLQINVQEHHINFSFHKLENLSEIKILPSALHECLLRWVNNKQPFCETI